VRLDASVIAVDAKEHASHHVQQDAKAVLDVQEDVVDVQEDVVLDVTVHVLAHATGVVMDVVDNVKTHALPHAQQHVLEPAKLKHLVP
jgi:hypothetical protein